MLDLSDTQLLNHAQPIRLLVLDVDGILSDGQLYINNHMGEVKSFSALDGQGIKMLQGSGVKVAIITGRISMSVTQRAKELNIELVLQGREDKLNALNQLNQNLLLRWDEIAYMGDDLPDLAAIIKVGLGITVPNAASTLGPYSQYVTNSYGGRGAIREVCELIMQAQGTWDAALAPYFNSQLTVDGGNRI